MREINLKSDEVKGLHTRGPKDFQVSINGTNGTVLFNTVFCISKNLKAGQRVNFINDGGDWRFYIDGDKDGFELKTACRGTGSLKIQHSGLAHLIMKSTGNEGYIIFKIQETLLEKNTHKIYWIKTGKH